MLKNWDRAIASVLRWEGGSAIRANEPGGAVNRGVSLEAFRHEHPGASVQDLLNMSEDEAKRIYRKNYADKIDFDNLPDGMDAVMLHGAVMFGVSGIKKMAAQANGDWGHLVTLMMQNKMHRTDGVKFMPGWSDRFVAVYELAKELANGVSP